MKKPAQGDYPHYSTNKLHIVLPLVWEHSTMDLTLSTQQPNGSDVEDGRIWSKSDLADVEEDGSDLNQM